MGLRVKLFLVWLTLLLTPLAILAGIGYVYIDSQLRKELILNQADISESIAGAANTYISRLHFLTANTANHPDLQQLSQSATPTAVQKNNVERMLTALIRGDEDIEQYHLLNVSGNRTPILSVADSSLDANIIGLVRAIIEDKPQQPSTRFITLKSASSSQSNERLLTLVPVTGSNNGVTGYLISIASTNSLRNLTTPRNNRDSVLMIIAENGAVITPSQEISIRQFPQPDTVFNQSENGFLNQFFIGNTSFMLRLHKLEESFWLASLTDNELLWKKKLPYIFIFVMAISLTLLLSGVVFNLIVNRIAIRPIKELIDATREIAKGEFRPDIDVRSKDELGELASAFRQMGKQLMHTSRRIRQLAYYDPLTQLPNRTTLRETLNRLLTRAESSKSKCAVLFIDLDDFKKVNDRLGHEAGDELLIQISDRLKNRLRQADVLFEQAGITSIDQLISRRGGDEFNAILSAIKAPHDAAIVAERIIQDLNEPFFVASTEIHVGASVGIAVFPDDGRDADTLLRNADLAMYEAKARGKNNYHIFTSAINDQVHQRLALENALQRAMVQNQFRLYYQPKVRLSDMTPVGFEALIRWHHPEKGIILPSKFIPVAEESNLIRDIGNWILGESMQQIQLWEKMLPEGVRIAINISARQLSQVDLVEQLETMMQHFNLPPHRLEIELTETSVLHDEVMASQHLTALRKLGVEVSLDDFGTGYSSLSFLRKLPIDTVKIDRSFTANVNHNSEARAIVVSLLALCRELNVTTIAEGIETTAQLQFLLEHGCDQGQGYLFSEPLPSEDVQAFLTEPTYIA